MSLKTVIFFMFTIFLTNPIFASQQLTSPQRFSWSWFKSFLVTPTTEQKQKKFAEAIQKSAASGKSLDLLTFYKTKEQSENFTDAKEAAKKFKNAVKNAAQRGGIMARFKTTIPEQFLFGTSSSSYQYEGGLDEHNANAIFYRNKVWKDEKSGQEKIGLETAGKAIDFWNRYKKDMQLMKNELGINCFRLSIAWDRVQPNSKTWDEAAINQYIEMIKTLRRYAIEPIVVLHHYTIPQWFAEIGGFEKSQNITYFVEFAMLAYVLNTLLLAQSFQHLITCHFPFEHKFAKHLYFFS